MITLWGYKGVRIALWGYKGVGDYPVGSWDYPVGL